MLLHETGGERVNAVSQRKSKFVYFQENDFGFVMFILKTPCLVTCLLFFLFMSLVISVACAYDKLGMAFKTKSVMTNLIKAEMKRVW